MIPPPGCKGGYTDGLKENVSKYCGEQKMVKQWFREIRSKKDRRLFLVTNSEYSHADLLMKNCYGPGWKSFFDIIVCKARKKNGFFSITSEVPAPVEKVETGKKKRTDFGDCDDLGDNDFVKLDDFGVPLPKIAGTSCELELGGVYNGGNAKKLTEFMFKGNFMITTSSLFLWCTFIY
jgi:hypothetical protein